NGARWTASIGHGVAFRHDVRSLGTTCGSLGDAQRSLTTSMTMLTDARRSNTTSLTTGTTSLTTGTDTRTSIPTSMTTVTDTRTSIPTSVTTVTTSLTTVTTSLTTVATSVTTVTTVGASVGLDMTRCVASRCTQTPSHRSNEPPRGAVGMDAGGARWCVREGRGEAGASPRCVRRGGSRRGNADVAAVRARAGTRGRRRVPVDREQVGDELLHDVRVVRVEDVRDRGLVVRLEERGAEQLLEAARVAGVEVRRADL